jgi:hypothetical protein
MHLYHVTPACNIRRILNAGLLAKRGERSASCGELGKGVWFFVNEDGLEYGLTNWLDAMFEESTRLALFTVKLSPKEEAKLEISGIEAAYPNDIPPENVVLLSRDIDLDDAKLFHPQFGALVNLG